MLPGNLKRSFPTAGEQQVRKVRLMPNPSAAQVQAIPAPNLESNHETAPAGARPKADTSKLPARNSHPAPSHARIDSPRMLPTRRPSDTSRESNRDDNQPAPRHGRNAPPRMLPSHHPKNTARGRFRPTQPAPSHGRSNTPRMLSSQTAKKHSPPRSPNCPQRMLSSQIPPKPATQLYGPRTVPASPYRNDTIQRPIVPDVPKSGFRPTGFRPLARNRSTGAAHAGNPQYRQRFSCSRFRSTVNCWFIYIN